MKTNIFKPKNLFLIFLGNTTMALGIVMFVLPNNLMTGGTTGLSLIVDHYLNLPISVFVFIFNCIMFLLGAVILGIDFALTTLISTFYYPIALGFFQSLPALSGITDDRLLSSIRRSVYRILSGNRHPRRSFHRRYGHSSFDPEQEIRTSCFCHALCI